MSKTEWTITALGLLAWVWFCLQGMTNQAELKALECARKSAGTDAAIVQCYRDLKLPIPKDL